MAEEEECPECPAGIPAWVMTFADLMSLLMCFFVLILSFSQMDVLKYKQLAGHMASAFGVQADIVAEAIPKGTSAILQNFSPSAPEPTPINEVRQSTVDEQKVNLDVMCADNSTEEDPESAAQVVVVDNIKELIKETEQDAQDVATALAEEINQGQVEIESQGRKIVIRIKENGSFESGSAELEPDFIPIMAKIRGALKDTPGAISVEGHTDDIPIRTSRFRSNWDLSSSRASSVALELMATGEITPFRFHVTGYAETRPLVANADAASRAINRRVEIVIQQGLDKESKDVLPEIEKIDPELYKQLKGYTQPSEGLRPEEIF